MPLKIETIENSAAEIEKIYTYNYKAKYATYIHFSISLVIRYKYLLMYVNAFMWMRNGHIPRI